MALRLRRPTLSSDLIDLPDGLLGPDVSHGIVKPRHSDPEPVEPLVRPIDGDDRGPGVGLGHSPVPLQHHDLRPDLVIDAFPLVPDLLDVVLGRESDFNSVTQSNEVLT